MGSDPTIRDPGFLAIKYVAAAIPLRRRGHVGRRDREEARARHAHAAALAAFLLDGRRQQHEQAPGVRVPAEEQAPFYEMLDALGCTYYDETENRVFTDYMR